MNRGTVTIPQEEYQQMKDDITMLKSAISPIKITKTGITTSAGWNINLIYINMEELSTYGITDLSKIKLV